jgi:hypothetical protein
MKILQVIGTDGYELAHPDDGWDPSIDLLDGTPRSKAWKPFRVKIVTHEKNGKPFLRSESPWFCMSHALIFRQDAILKLGQFLSGIGEVLPLRSDHEPLFIWQPISVVDAVDFTKSQVWRFKDGRLMDIRRYSFHRDRIEGFAAFKTPDLRARPIFFSERAADTILDAVGPCLTFMPVWDG